MTSYDTVSVAVKGPPAKLDPFIIVSGAHWVSNIIVRSDGSDWLRAPTMTFGGTYALDATLTMTNKGAIFVATPVQVDAIIAALAVERRATLSDTVSSDFYGYGYPEVIRGV